MTPDTHLLEQTIAKSQPHSYPRTPRLYQCHPRTNTPIARHAALAWAGLPTCSLLTWTTLPHHKLTNDNPLTDLKDRRRAPLKQLRRCLENHPRTDSSISETPDEEVDYGSFESIAKPIHLPIRIIMHREHLRMIVKTKWQVCID
jgi:hypothetical protein